MSNPDPTDLIAATSPLPGGSRDPEAPRQGTPSDPAAIDLTPIRDRAKALEHAAAKAKEWKQIADDLQAEIKAAMGGDDGQAEVGLVDGQAFCRWTRVKSNRFNQSAFKKDHPDDYALYVEPQETRRFTLVDPA